MINHGKLVLAPIYTVASGMPPESVGLIAGLSGLGSVWFFAASGGILPRFGPIKALIFACVLAPTAAIMFALEQSWLVLPSALFIGFAYAITAPAGSQILATHTPKKLWGTLFSLRMAGVPVGGAVAGVLGAFLAARYDWRIALLAIITPALLTGLFLIFASKKITSPISKDSFKILNLFKPSNFISPFKVLLRIPGLPLITFVSVGFAAIQGGVFTFLTTYLTKELGFSLTLAGGLYATMQGASFIGRVFAGLIADRFFSARTVLVTLGLMSATGVSCLTLINGNFSPALLFPAVGLIGVSIASWNGLFMAEVSNIAENYDVSEATSASTFFTFISYMLAPPCFGLIAISYGYTYAFLSVGFCGLLAVGALLLQTIKERRI
jgi:MFS family permease